jgi:septum formation protein
MNPATTRLILASTSRYRQELLSRLRLPFETVAPHVEEQSLPEETPRDTAARLALSKARAVAERYADAVVIGADQVAEAGRTRLEKPGIKAVAAEQLAAASGRSVDFHTALCVASGRTGRELLDVITTRVTFRHLSPGQISRYLDMEQPYDCAGSAKAEGLGIALIERIEGPDPTALIGLPLIRLTSMLQEHGLPVL